MSCPARYDPALGSWVVHDPADVRAVLLDRRTFSASNALSAHTPIGAEAMRTLASVGFSLPPSLANNSGPSHRPIRRLVASFFSPARVASVEPVVAALAGSRLGAVAEQLDRDGSADLVGLLADVVPATVLLELLGLGDRGLELGTLKGWSRDSLELFWGWPSAERQQDLATNAAEFYSWLRAQDVRARHSGGQDLFGQLAGSGLSPREVCATAYFLLVAGHETTSQLIATAFLRLIGDPRRWQSLAGDVRGAAAAVDDLLRDESSVPTWRRESRAPSTIGQVRIPVGASILLRLTGTGGTADLAFGLGSHRCLGARLATMQTRVVIAAAAAALPAVRLVEREPPMLELLSFRAPRRVIVGRRVPSESPPIARQPLTAKP